MQTSQSEIVLASVVHLKRVRVDRGMTQAEWNNSHALRHFSIIRKLDARPFPPGNFAFHTMSLPCWKQKESCWIVALSAVNVDQKQTPLGKIAVKLWHLQGVFVGGFAEFFDS